MKKAFIGLLALAGIAVVLCGCRATSVANFVICGQQPCVQNRPLARWVAIEKSKIVREGDASPVGLVTIRNLNKEDFPFEYRFTWLDKNGAPLNSVLTTWVQAAFAGKDEQTLRAVSPVKQAENFKFEVRFYHSSTRW